MAAAERPVMSRVIDPSWLSLYCNQNPDKITPGPASAAAQGLAGLARWWLDSKALRQAREMVPDKVREAWADPTCSGLSSSGGSCFLIAHLPDDHWPTLRRSLLWPVVWVQSKSDDPHLPAAFHEIARRVKKAVSFTLKSPNWHLKLDTQVTGDVNLNRIPTELESAWASLVAGLLIADRQGSPKPHVWASGVWKEDKGFQPSLGGLEQKLDLAATCGVEVFFVPQSRVRKAADFISSKYPTTNIRVESLSEKEVDPIKAIEPLREKLQIPPGREATIGQRREWAALLGDFNRYKVYREEMCLNDEIEQLRKDRPDSLKKVTWLVLIASGGVSGKLSVGALKPRSCLVLYTASFRNEAEHIKTSAEELGLTSKLSEFHEGDDMPNELKQLVRTFVSETRAKPDQLAFDLTGGKVNMKMSLALHAAPAGSVLFYTDSTEYDARNRPVPVTMKWHTWVAPGDGEAPSVV